MIAAAEEPVGRKANWSERFRVGGVVRKAGYRYVRTIVLSMILERIGVIDIGRNVCVLAGRVDLRFRPYYGMLPLLRYC